MNDFHFQVCSEKEKKKKLVEKIRFVFVEAMNSNKRKKNYNIPLFSDL